MFRHPRSWSCATWTKRSEGDRGQRVRPQLHRPRRQHRLPGQRRRPRDGDDGHHQALRRRAPRTSSTSAAAPPEEGDRRVQDHPPRPEGEGVFVNIFGGIMKCDVIAEGVIAAARELGSRCPLVVRLEGTNVEIGKKMLADSGLASPGRRCMATAKQKIVAPREKKPKKQKA
jgi:hypothetical protein